MIIIRNIYSFMYFIGCYISHSGGGVGFGGGWGALEGRGCMLLFSPHDSFTKQKGAHSARRPLCGPAVPEHISGVITAREPFEASSLSPAPLVEEVTDGHYHGKKVTFIHGRRRRGRSVTVSRTNDKGSSDTGRPCEDGVASRRRRAPHPS